MQLQAALLLGLPIILTLVTACPGEDAAMLDLEKQLAKRQEAESGEYSYELIGDLVYPGATTPVGKQIQEIIVGKGAPESDESYDPLLFTLLYSKDGAMCKQDPCCIWKWVAREMESKFKGSSGRCNKYARAAVRLGFHDAGTWSKTSGAGGADGSIILANEGYRGENNGLQEITAVTLAWYNSYKKYGVGMADLIQFGAKVATVVCPLGPRIRTFIGRADSYDPSPTGLMPNVFADAEYLIKLFEDKTIRPHGLAALVGAHSTSQQKFVDRSRADDPQDSSPGVWDVQFYGQTLGTEPTPKRVFKLPSDVKLSRHPRISTDWAEFSGSGQGLWNQDYAREYIRLSLLGVNRINQLTECTKVLPRKTTSYSAPDQVLLDKWLDGGLPGLGGVLQNAVTITTTLLSQLGIKLVRDVEALMVEKKWIA